MLISALPHFWVDYGLCMQVCLLAFQLLGGSISRGVPGDRANMYSYQGPKGILVGGDVSLAGRSRRP